MQGTILKQCDYPGCEEEVGFSGKGKGRGRWGELGRTRFIQVPRSNLGLPRSGHSKNTTVAVNRLCDGHYTSAKFVRRRR